MEKWNDFTVEFSKNILPLYEKHEKTFDSYGIHSRLHISRSIVFSEFMSRFFKNELNYNIDIDIIRYAVSFHDSGRERNGIDLWEKDSAKNCFNYLIDNDHDADFSIYTSNLIIKNYGVYDDNKKIVTDADVLEIMRPLCGHGGKQGFNPKYLYFLKENEKYQDVRKDLIEDAWLLIKYTEDNKQLFNSKSNDHLYILLDIIEKYKNDFKILTKFQL